jgi:hypothetical protein
VDPELPALGTFPLRAGATVIVAGPTPGRAPYVRYVIAKRVSGDEGKRREGRQRRFFEASGFAPGTPSNNRAFEIDFALVHGRA